MEVINYTIAEFLGFFLIGFPVLLFILPIFVRGILWLAEDILEEPKKEIFSHFHYHYRNYPPRHLNK